MEYTSRISRARTTKAGRFPSSATRPCGFRVACPSDPARCRRAGFIFLIVAADIGVVSSKPRLLQAIRMLEISRKDSSSHSAHEQGFVGHLLRRLSALRLNVSNLTLRAARKCPLSLRFHFGTRFALFAASSPIAVRWSLGRTRRRVAVRV